MGAEPRRDPARLPDRAERRELRLSVEPVARLRLEGRRALAEHPRAVQLDRSEQARPLPPRASRARSRGSRRPRRAAPRSSPRRRGARTRRRGRRRTPRACGSRRGPGPRTARGSRAPRRRRRAPGRSCIRPTASIVSPAQRTNASSSTSTSPSAGPRSGAPFPAGVASCARSRSEQARGGRRHASPGTPGIRSSAFLCGGERLRIAGVHVPHHARARVGRQHALEPFRLRVAAVRDDDHPCVDRVADPDAAAVVDAHPRRSRRHVDERVEDRPVRDRVGAVAHRLGLAIRARRPSPHRGDPARSPPAP